MGEACEASTSTELPAENHRTARKEGAVSKKTVFITGGTGALGQAVVQAVVGRGHAASVVYRARAEWQRLNDALPDAEEHLLGLEGDALSPEFMATAVQATGERFGSLDGLFHLVGGYAYASLGDTAPDLWRRMLDLNLSSAYVAARATLPALTASRGVMVFVGTQAALTTPANQSAYNAGKAGVMALAQTLAKELRPKGIRVNSVVPDIIDTPANRQSMPNAKYGQWLAPEQVADVLLYLLSDEGSGVTGATIALQRS
jgi:NAD(P)-dependent dehydrogenase (short-subunit alcohol dehydrogenase family)